MGKHGDIGFSNEEGQEFTQSNRGNALAVKHPLLYSDGRSVPVIKAQGRSSEAAILHGLVLSLLRHINIDLSRQLL